MPTDKLDKDKLSKKEDWVGKTIAVTCPICGKVFLAGADDGLEGRECPICHKSTAFVSADGSEARVEW